MRHFLGKTGLEETYQDAFPETVACMECGGKCDIAVVVAEDGGKPGSYICNLHDSTGEPGGLWLHDCCCIAVYFCRDCLEATTLWNQG